MLTRIKGIFRRLPNPLRLFKSRRGGKGRAVLGGLGVLALASGGLAFFHRFPLHVYKAKNDSMAPTLYLGDRFGVERFSTWFGEPGRFDVVTYRFPMDEKRRLAHRVIGLPEERVRIDNGDVWVRPKGEKWQVLRKPAKVQKHLWKRVDAPAGADAWTVLEEEGVSWSVSGERLEAATFGQARFGAEGTSITDAYVHGHSEGRRVELRVPPGLEENVVGDLRLSGWVRANADCAEAFIELHEGKRVHRFTIPGPAAPDGAQPTVGRGKKLAAGQPFRLPADTEIEFSAANLDDQLIFSLDGGVIATIDIDDLEARSNEIRVGFVGGGGVWEDLVVERDVHYVSPPERDFSVTVPEGHYLLLGDNTQHFADPRFWRVLHLSVKGADGTEHYEGNLRPTENPRTYVEDGEIWIQFRDADGKKHEFLRDSVKKRTFEPSPFVPRELIEGRVFMGLGD